MPEEPTDEIIQKMVEAMTLAGGYSYPKMLVAEAYRAAVKYGRETEDKPKELIVKDKIEVEDTSLLKVGAAVEKVGGDYTFVGTIVSVFKKLSNATRFVVEDDRGVLHVYSEKNLKRSTEQ